MQKKNDGTTALMLAALAGRNDIVESLLAKGADVNAQAKNGRTALMDAALHCSKNVVAALVAKGADVTAKANDGTTALMEALLADHMDVAELLLAKGADINAKRNSGATALIDATLLDHKDAAEWLLAKGADANAKMEDGTTALMNAALMGDEDVVEWLLTKGADIRAKRNDGKTALLIAEMAHNHRAVANLLFEDMKETKSPSLVRPRHDLLRLATPHVPKSSLSSGSATLPFRLGEPMSEVMVQMARMGLPSIKPTAKQTFFSSEGIRLFFGRNQCVREIRLEAPFSGSVDGIRIGDHLSTLTATLGESTARPFPFAGNMAYVYQTAGPTYRFDVSRDSVVQGIFIFQKKRNRGRP